MYQTHFSFQALKFLILRALCFVSNNEQIKWQMVIFFLDISKFMNVTKSFSKVFNIHNVASGDFTRILIPHI